MSAVNYEKLDDVLVNLQFQLEATPLLAAVSALIEGYRIANAGFLLIPLDLGQTNDMLRKLTGCTVGIPNDMNCYPRGFVDTVCFDLSGNPV